MFPRQYQMSNVNIPDYEWKLYFLGLNIWIHKKKNRENFNLIRVCHKYVKKKISKMQVVWLPFPEAPSQCGMPTWRSHNTGVWSLWFLMTFALGLSAKAMSSSGLKLRKFPFHTHSAVLKTLLCLSMWN